MTESRSISHKKKCCFFQSSTYFTEVQYSKKTIIFQGSRGGPTFSRRRGGGGGPNFFQGVNCLIFPIETYITCDFPGGPGRPVPSFGSAHVSLSVQRPVRPFFHSMAVGGGFCVLLIHFYDHYIFCSSLMSGNAYVYTA